MQTEQIRIASDAEAIGSRYIIAFNTLSALLSETSSAVGGAKAIARLLDMGDPDVQAAHADAALERALTRLDDLGSELDRILGPNPDIARQQGRAPCYVEDAVGNLVGTTDNQ